MQESRSICGSCWQNLSFISKPWCEKCGLPKVFETGNVCSCENMPCKNARSALIYNDKSKNLLLKFKHADQTQHATLLAGWMLNAASDIIPEIHCFLPVPLHWKRLMKRKYNQSAILASILAKKTGKTLDTQALQRIRATPPQQSLKQRKRLSNVQGAFAVKHPERLRNKHVALIDDVWTTGATLTECTEVLLKAGVASVSWICAARVVRAEDMDEILDLKAFQGISDNNTATSILS